MKRFLLILPFTLATLAAPSTALALPPGYRMCGGLMIGYPEFEYARIPTRNAARVTWE